MTTRDALKQNLNKWCKVVMTDGFILGEGYASESWINESTPYMDDEVVKIERGRSSIHFRQSIVIVIK